MNLGVFLFLLPLFTFLLAEEPEAPDKAGICLRGRVEISHRDIDGSCSSTCPNKVHLAAFLKHGCVKISTCVIKPSSWTLWFSHCDLCECDCYIPCTAWV